ncbi:hypothetical protein [Mesorhizobium sp. IMUNJ 23232]|uniref:hypothetical protein n=1 Tax=Mesorhizobium sp. IMUNJ 23232 TaxID=3376064 RepID=UPI0037B18716
MDRVVANGVSRVGWFAAGALSLAAAIALFLFADSYFSAKADLASDQASRTIVEGK